MARRKGQPPSWVKPPRRPGCTGLDDCMCPWCLVEDMNRHVFNELDKDPADYPVRLPDGRVVRPPSAAAMLAHEAEQAANPAPSHVDDGQHRIRVAYTGPGVWAKFTGLDQVGNRVTVSGAVVAGPTGRPDGWLALVVDLYDKPRTRVPLVTTSAAWCELVSAEEGLERQLAHTLNPIFGDGAISVRLLRHRPGLRPGLAGQWVPETLHDVSAAQLADLENDPRVFLTNVHHNPIPVPADLMGDTR